MAEGDNYELWRYDCESDRLVCRLKDTHASLVRTDAQYWNVLDGVKCIKCRLTLDAKRCDSTVQWYDTSTITISTCGMKVEMRA